MRARNRDPTPALLVSSFLPRHMKKQIGVPVGTLSCAKRFHTLPILLTVPLVGALWLANRYFYPRNLIQLTIETLLVSSVYAVGLFWASSHQPRISCRRDCGCAETGADRAKPPQAVIAVEYQNEQ